MKLKVVYFTFVDIRSDHNGGAICCRNHIKRLSIDAGIELFVVIAGAEEQKTATLSYLNSLGVSGQFVAFRELMGKTKTTFVQKLAPIPWEEFVQTQRHIDQAVCESVASTHADVLLIDYFYSAMFCSEAIKKAPKSALVIFNPETKFYEDILKKNKDPLFKKTLKLTRMWLTERLIFKSMDKIIALSPPDVPPHKGMCITPYLDMKPKQWKSNSSRTIFFIGHFMHYPNQEAMEYIINQLAPAVTAILPDVRFKIIGASVHDISFHHPSVDLLGKSDTHEAEQLFLNCQLFICPVKNTFGLKFKIAEALSYGTPFLASPESMQCVPYLKDQPTLSMTHPIQAAKNIAALLLNEKGSADLATSINLRHRQFIDSQKNIWSRSLR